MPRQKSIGQSLARVGEIVESYFSDLYRRDEGLVPLNEGGLETLDLPGIEALVLERLKDRDYASASLAAAYGMKAARKLEGPGEYLERFRAYQREADNCGFAGGY
jgi:hypothetical protein